MLAGLPLLPSPSAGRFNIIDLGHDPLSLGERGSLSFMPGTGRKNKRQHRAANGEYMEFRKLGRTDLNVSSICLGTMTWGEQNTEAEGHAQMDFAMEQGINFFDTAELYSVPPKKETKGRTEEIIGLGSRTQATATRLFWQPRLLAVLCRIGIVKTGLPVSCRADRSWKQWMPA